MRCGFGRAHRGLSKTVSEPTWSNLWANPDVFFIIFGVFLAFFSSILGFSPRWKMLRRKKSSAFDRARRALSWSNVGLIWSNLWANPFEKYSNPDQRYPTSRIGLNPSMDADIYTCRNASLNCFFLSHFQSFYFSSIIKHASKSSNRRKSNCK